MGLIIIITLIYFIGTILYCVLNEYRIGKFEDYERIDAEDIVFEASFWPVYGVIKIILLPFKELLKLTRWLHYRKHGNKSK